MPVSPGRRSRSGSRPARRGRRGRSLSRSASRNGSHSPMANRDRKRSYRRSSSRSPLRGYRHHTYGDRYNPEPNRVLGVFNLPKATNERDLDKLFGKYGDIDQIRLVRDHYTRESRGYAFIYFDRLKDATRARNKLMKTYVDGREIRVDFSISGCDPRKSGGSRYNDGDRQRRSRRPSRSTSGHRQRRESRSVSNHRSRRHSQSMSPRRSRRHERSPSGSRARKEPRRSVSGSRSPEERNESRASSVDSKKSSSRSPT